MENLAGDLISLLAPLIDFGASIVGLALQFAAANPAVSIAVLVIGFLLWQAARVTGMNLRL